MKIAIFHNVTSGGAKRTTYEHAKRLSERHQVDLFSLSSANHSFDDIQPYVNRTELVPFQTLPLFNSPLGRLNQAVRIADLLRLRRTMRQLAEMINAGGYDVALVHPCMFTFTPTILRYLKVPSLYYRHDPVRWVQDPEIPRPYYKKSAARQFLNRIDPMYRAYFRLLVYEDASSMRAATRVVTNSYFTRESLYRIYSIAPTVCYHGVDFQLFHSMDLERQNYVISVGAIAPYKGYDFLVRSLACIPANVRPRLILVGNVAKQDEQQYLAQLAAQSGVEVDFRHLITNEELIRLYNQAMCTVYAPIMEPFGLVPLESMACGTPVVGIREGGVRETVVDGVTGLLADRDPEQFAKAIVTLLEDCSLVEQLGKQGRSRVEQHWKWEDAINSLERNLLEITQVATYYRNQR